MAQPSLLTVFLLLVSYATSNDQYFRQGLGELGKHYNLKKGYPYIQCEVWSPSEPVTAVDCGPPSSEFFGKRLGCNGVLRVKEPQRFRALGLPTVSLTSDDFERISGGCWHGSEAVHDQCLSEDECVGTVNDEAMKGITFCCCTTHGCNSNVSIRFSPTANGSSSLVAAAAVAAAVIGPNNQNLGPIDYDDQQAPPESAADNQLHPLAICAAAAATVVVVLTMICCMCRTTRLKRCLRWVVGGGKSLDSRGSAESGDGVPLVGIEEKRENLVEGLEIEETIIAQGKLSVVHRGKFADPELGAQREVAVKKIKERKSFQLEESVYRLCCNQHPSLLYFIGSALDEKEGLQYIVTEYQEKGCLEEYLKSTTLSPLESLSFLCSFMDGLSFLHSPQTLKSGGFKSPVVHRDIKSRNILVKADGTAAIADFGLAMICEGNRSHGRHYQVGTHRYMSPELLVGQANLNMEGLKMADVYAGALIIWEMLSRTLIDEADEVEPAQLPYTKEVEERTSEEESDWEKTHPGEEYMRKPIQYYLAAIVHGKNERPRLRARLREDPITLELVKTTLDMWDFEVDGRISAACAHARFETLLKDAQNGTINRNVLMLNDVDP